MKTGTWKLDRGAAAAWLPGTAARLGAMLACLELWGESAAAAGDPPWLAELTRHPAGNAATIQPCRLEYAFSWSDIVKAGSSAIDFGIEEDRRYPGMLAGRSEGGSRGAARLLWPYDFTFTSILDPVSLRPVAFHSTEIDRRETLWTTNRYGVSGVDITAVTLDKKSGVREEKKAVFPFPECHDLMSGFLYARSLPLREGEEVVILVHPFAKAYIVRFKVLGKEKHRIGLGEFDAFKVDIDVSKVESDLTLKHYKKVRRATAWISDDAYRLPLEVRAEIFVGSIRVELVKRELPGEESGTARALESPAAQAAKPASAGIGIPRVKSPFRRK